MMIALLIALLIAAYLFIGFAAAVAFLVWVKRRREYADSAQVMFTFILWPAVILAIGAGWVCGKARVVADRISST